MTLLADDPEIAGRSGTVVAATRDVPVTDVPVTDVAVTDAGPEIVERDAAEALRLACEHLKARQEPEGWWKGELETNVTMDAEDILLRHFLGILDQRTLTGAADRIRSQQRRDGPWATFHGGPGELSATVEAYVALRLAGDDPGDPHMSAAAAWVREHGGVESTRVFTHVWLAMVGRWDWDKLPAVPPELIFLPPEWPISIWSFACWARQTIVALSVITAHRPSRPLPFEIEELRSGKQPRRRHLSPLGWALVGLDRALHRYEEVPAESWPKRVIRGAALREAERWIVARQEADGSWGGIQPPMVYSTIALVLQGYPLDHPVLAAAIAGLDAFALEDDRGRRIEACQSPVWDTALAAIALVDAGTAPGDPAMKAARDWLLDQEVTVVGDWAVRRPNLAPGGWAFEFQNVHYPDIDDTAEVVLALRHAAADPGSDAACNRAIDWLVGMQSSDGGWGAFDADNTSTLPTQLPFFDFGAVTDPPTADVTAHVVEMLACEPHPLAPARQDALQRGLDWLAAHQERNGSYWGRWGVNYVYGTGAVLPALIAAGVPAKDPTVADGVRWLLEHQNLDGGWGEDMRSYVEPGWAGRGASTASQTAWALIGLIAAGERDNPATARGIAWLVNAQTEDGTWDEPWFTGTGFPWDFSLNYHLYRHVFPLTALGRYLLGTGPRPKTSRAKKPEKEASTVQAPRLLVLAPLRVEAMALGPGATARVGPATLEVERIGMGLRKASDAARRLRKARLSTASLRTSGPEATDGAQPPYAAIAVAGLGGALGNDLVPGDLVVADRLIDAEGTEVARLPSAPLLAGELRRLGLRARTGTVVSTDHIVTGDERAALAALGALAVDMESTAVASQGWGVPLAVLRAISDTPGEEPFSPAGVRGAWAGLQALRASRHALANWAAAASQREILLAEPRSFCAGVRRAIETVERALDRYGAPVYVRRQIVHNAYVVSRLEEAGAVFVEELAEVPDGSNVVFSAHGVGTAVQKEAAARQMFTIDATCPLVSKVHNEARRFAGSGRQLVLIGHAGHDEVEGTLGTVAGTALVSTAEDVSVIDLDASKPTAFITQTTLATDEVAGVVTALERRFSDLARPAASDICYATQNRQEAVRQMAPDCDVVLVVGSPNSSNSNRLVEVAQRCGARAHLVDSKLDLRLSWLVGARRVGVTAGASAPEELVREVVDCVAALGCASIEERSTGNERVSFPLPMEVR